MSEITLTIEGEQVTVKSGTTILEAARKLGIEIPTLCYHPDLTEYGSCRVCDVEDLESGSLLASCISLAEEGMELEVNSARARQARRMNVELLLASHPNECLTCDRNGTCELQDIAHNLGISEIDLPTEPKNHPAIKIGPSLKQEPSKCILCGRCVRLCEEIQGVSALDFTNRGFNSVVTTAFNLPKKDINCANCGQCATVCPTGAITEIREIEQVWKALEDDSKHVVVQTAPSIEATLGEEFGLAPGSIVTDKLVASLRKLGFDKVFSTDFAADLTIMEEGNELLNRFQTGRKLPQLTSCCPGWVKFCEHNYPELLPNLSTAKSPQQMFSALTKTYYAEKAEIDPQDIYTVAIMPCTAKKFEKDRAEMNDSGYKDTDAVLTTRELAQMIKEVGICFSSLEAENEEFDELMGTHSGASVIFGTTGGVMEAALRTVYESLTDDELKELEFEEIRGIKGAKEAEIEINERIIKVAATHGLANAAQLIDKIQAGEAEYHFVEVMACPTGCVGGGGQPLPTNTEIKLKRAQGLYSIDQSDEIRKSHENPQVQKLYDEFLVKPLSGEAHQLLHTNYEQRNEYDAILDKELK